jgi:hypothetical protein
VKYGSLFLLIAASSLTGVAITSIIATRAICAACALSFLLVALAYLLNIPAVFCKRPSGSIPWWAWPVHWPYSTLSWLSYAIYRQIDRRPATCEIAPGVWLGRRLTAREAAAHQPAFGAVLDLACEFPRTPIPNATYRSLPVLDATPPSLDQIRSAVGWIDEHRPRGPILIHCALGHGRSASIVAAWLLSHADGDRLVSRAVETVQQLRPGVQPNKDQICRLREYRKDFSPDSPPPSSPAKSGEPPKPLAHAFTVLACINPGHIRIMQGAGRGSGPGLDLPIDTIPPDLRAPNTPLWVTFHDDKSVAVIRRDPNDQRPFKPA